MYAIVLQLKLLGPGLHTVAVIGAAQGFSYEQLMGCILMGIIMLSGTCGFKLEPPCWILVNALNLLKTWQIKLQLTLEADLVIKEIISA